LAKEVPKEGTLVEGVLTSKDFTFQIISPAELTDFTELVTAPIIQKMSVISHAPAGLIRWHLEQMYGTVDQIEGGFMV
jgi:cleavage and polyadenylation specificity factor subunit 3